MTRLAGSWVGTAQVFKAVAIHYGWKHIVLLSDDDTDTICWYGAQPFEAMFGSDPDYMFYWLRIGSDPTDKELDAILQQIRSCTRGLYTS